MSVRITEEDLRGAVEATQRLLRSMSDGGRERTLQLPVDEFYERVLTFARNALSAASSEVRP